MINTVAKKNGIIEMEIPLHESEDIKNSADDNKNSQVEELNENVDSIQDNDADSIQDNIVENIFEIDYILDSKTSIKIQTLEEFNEIKADILKCNYVSIYRKDYAYSIVGDNGSYFVIDTDAVPINEINKVLVFRKPKKVLFNINEFNGLAIEGSSGFIDMRLVFKFLFNQEYKRIYDLFFYIKAPQLAYKNVYLVCSNLINIAKAINIHVEKNRLNKQFYQEMDIAQLASIVGDRGIPINKNTFDNYIDDIKSEYKQLEDKKKEIYGEKFDFSNTQVILKEIKNELKTLNPELLNAYPYNEALLSDYLLYNNYHDIPKLKVNDDRLKTNYDTYYNFGIKPSIEINRSLLNYEQYTYIEGRYVDLYYKVFAELTKIEDIIEKASKDVLFNYINGVLYEEDTFLKRYTSLFIKAYANNIYETIDIQNLLIEKYLTLINVGDISAINHAFNNKFEKLMQFFKNFNGTDAIYERYNKKIFSPTNCLDDYIHQIMNNIMKDTILVTDAGVKDYNNKFGNSISIIEFTRDSITLATSDDESAKAGIDILNRTLKRSYSKFIKNTHYYIVNEPIKSIQNNS